MLRSAWAAARPACKTAWSSATGTATAVTARAAVGPGPGPRGAAATAAGTRGFANASAGPEAARRFSPVSWTTLGVTLAVGGAAVYYFRLEREKKNQKVIVQETLSVGKPKLGGPFDLVDQNGRPYTDVDLQGQWSLIYFGFTHCPDICPEELSKMVEIVDSLPKLGVTDPVRPVFISVDPKRDTVAQVRAYVKEFSPKLVGLTGSPEQVARAARAYRVYFSVSSGDDASADGDYLVDHSIFFYLLDPTGRFVDYYGQNKTAEQCLESIAQHVRSYRPPASVARPPSGQ